VAILDDTLSFGPLGRLRAAWSVDTAAIRRQGTWLELVSTLRWSIRVVPVDQPPVANAGPDRSAPNAGYSIGAADSATVTIADDPPTVNLVATDSDAAERGPDSGVFTFTRTGGNLAAALTVSVTRTGTATNVSDFVTIPSSVTIPAGQASVTLIITPIDDGAVEGIETVTLTLNASGSVVVGSSASATVSIADND
jgi:hypothetical protein